MDRDFTPTPADHAAPFPAAGSRAPLTAEQKDALRGVARMRHYSFPNGSSYDQQELPGGTHDTPLGRVVIAVAYGDGYHVTWADGTESRVSFWCKSVGAGADFGAHFCTRDQYLADLL